MTARELLTSNLHPDGLWHARYPTAIYTLCSLEALDPQPVGRRRPPTCQVCMRTARRFHQIDASMPAHWLTADLDAAA